MLPPGVRYKALLEQFRERATMAENADEREFYSTMAQAAGQSIDQIERSSNLIAESKALLAEADLLLSRRRPPPHDKLG